MFGDYDVDGAASVALIERFLRAHGQSPTTYIPDRLTEGYGPSPAALAGLAKDGARLILTVDCGTTSDTAIAAANAAGAEIIVIDHHQADDALPPAFAVINPNRQDDLSGQGHLAAAGVVFLFLVAATRALRREGFYRNHPEPDLLSLLDLVALATVCDVVPLREANRAFVAQGLKVLRLQAQSRLARARRCRPHRCGADLLHLGLHPRPAHQCRRQDRRVEPRRAASRLRRRDRGARDRRQARSAQ